MATTKIRNNEARPERTFEQALERLETIVGQMEDGSLGLDDLMARFEEGRELVAFCGGKLDEVEKKIEILLKKGDSVEARPFEPGAGNGGGTGA